MSSLQEAQVAWVGQAGGGLPSSSLPDAPFGLCSRTGEKLSTAPPEVQSDVSTAPAHCLLCLCPLDTNVGKWSSLGGGTTHF